MSYGTAFAAAIPAVASAEPTAAAAIHAWLLEAEARLEAKVTPAGFNINADLDYNTTYGAENVQHVELAAAAATKTGASNAGKLYRFNGELYFTNGSGTTTKVTQSGALNIAAVGAIGGDYSSDGNALVDYTTATSLYRLLSNLTNLARANVEVGALRVYGTGNNPSFRATLAVPSLAASYTMTLPSAVPASTSLLQMSAAGALTADPAGAVACGNITSSGSLSVATTSTFTGKATFVAEVAHPTRSRHVSSINGITTNGGGSTGSSRWEVTSANGELTIPVDVHIGETISSIDFHLLTGGTAGTRTVSVGFYSQSLGGTSPTFPGGSYAQNSTAVSSLFALPLNHPDFTVSAANGGTGATSGLVYARFFGLLGDICFGITVHYSRT